MIELQNEENCVKNYLIEKKKQLSPVIGEKNANAIVDKIKEENLGKSLQEIVDLFKNHKLDDVCETGKAITMRKIQIEKLSHLKVIKTIIVIFTIITVIGVLITVGSFS